MSKNPKQTLQEHCSCKIHDFKRKGQQGFGFDNAAMKIKIK